MWITSHSAIGDWTRRRKLGLEFRQYFFDRKPRGFIGFRQQHAPVALDVEADDLNLVHDDDPLIDCVSCLG